VAAQDALVAAELSGAHPTAATLMGTDALPDALREWAVDAERIQYLRHPNGQPIEIGRGATAHVFKALYRGEVVVSPGCCECCAHSAAWGGLAGSLVCEP